MASTLLDGIRVVEIGAERGAAAGAYLADIGAEVTRVLGGASRDAAYDAGKSVVSDDEELGALLSRADLLVCCDRRLLVGEGVLNIDSLRARYPALIIVAVTPFGLSGPFAELGGPELICSAMGGALSVCGYEDRPPVREALDACGFHAEMMAVAGAMFALSERDQSGEGQVVDISVQEVAASRMTNGILAWQFDRRRLGRTGVALSYGKARVRCVWDLADGHVFHSLMTGRFGAPANAALSAWMDEEGFENPMREVDWLAYDRSALPAEERAEWEAAIGAFFRSRTKAEMRVEGRRRGINACVVNEPGDVLADAHLEARSFWATGEQSGVSYRRPARFVRVVDGPEGGAATKSDLTGGSDAPALAGLRVLDFSWALVGSITTKLLADHGAEVIKVESSKRPCLSRIDVQVAASKRGNFDDKPWFIHMNTSKQSLQINMKHPEARAVIDPLIDWADVVVENFSPGTMKSLGLDYETLSQRRPDIVMVSGSVFGQTGPLAQEWGVDGTGAALSGRLALTGWPDRTPVTPSAVPYGDVVLPPIMAAAAVAAVRRRRLTGRGAHVDASMYEACVQQMAPAIVDEQIGRPHRRSGNDDVSTLLQGVFAADGRDVAVRVDDGDAWRSLMALVGAEGLDSDRRSEAERALAGWLAGRDPWEAMSALNAAGVAAGVVQLAEDLVDRDPQLAERGWLVDFDHPLLGRFAHQGSAIHLSRNLPEIGTAPSLGEDVNRICREVIGLDDARVAELRAADVFV